MAQPNKFGNILHPSAEEALAAWAWQVAGNREQAERFREAPEKPDFYSPTASVFKRNPRRIDDEALDVLSSMVRASEVWMDIGAGAGRYALPLALKAKEVITVEPSPGMLTNLRESMDEHNIHNIRIVQARWPMQDPPTADVSLMANVGYDIENIGAFLDAMEASTRRLCVAVMLDKAPASIAYPYWQAIHGENRVPLPALPEFLLLQIARGRLCEMHLVAPDKLINSNRVASVSFLRQQLFIEPEGEKDRKLTALLEEQSKQTGSQSAGDRQADRLGIVTWQPRVSEDT